MGRRPNRSRGGRADVREVPRVVTQNATRSDNPMAACHRHRVTFIKPASRRSHCRDAQAVDCFKRDDDTEPAVVMSTKRSKPSQLPCRNAV